MAMQCSRCDLIADEGEVCPKCGGAMRLTLLAGMKREEKSKAAERASATTLGPAVRFRQWLLGMFAWQIATLVLAAPTLYVLKLLRLEPSKLSETHPEILQAVLFVVPLVAIALATVVCQWKVYLAQLVGLAVGASAGLMVLGERVYLGWMPVWYEWLALPLIGTVVGFISGFVVAGPMPVEEKVAFEPIDAWDRDTKAVAVEINLPASRRWNQLFFGVSVWVGLLYGLRFLLVKLITPVYRGNLGMVDVIAHKAELPLLCFALFAGGVAAGSGTKTGFSQGLLTGLLILGLLYFFGYGNTEEFWLRVALPSLAAPTLGGMLGRKIFPPARVFRESAQPQQARPAKA